MNSVSFLYVNLIALCCYALMLTAFLAAKKTAENRAFLVVLTAFICWTGGSILMRLQLYPGVDFWFYVSLLGLFSVALPLYFFVCHFANNRGYMLKIVWSVGTVIILILSATGLFLEPPTVSVRADGGTVFLYEMKTLIIVPCLFYLAIIVSIIKILLDLIREKGIKTPGLISIIISCCVIGLGNVVQLIPGNVFPWDTLSGIFFAFFLMYALYKKRVFKMTLLISRNVLMVISVGICFLAAIYFVNPLESFMVSTLNVSPNYTTALMVVFFTVLMIIILITLEKIFNKIFSQDEQKNKLLKRFSNLVSHTLETDQVMTSLVNVIREEIPVNNIYICIQSEEGYEVRYKTNPLDSLSFTIGSQSAYLKYLRQNNSYFLLSEFKSSPLNLSVWEWERNLFSGLDIQCVAALKDGNDIVGLVLLPAKEKNASYLLSEMEFLETACSIASIAMKNAVLYERVYREARVDSLTGLYSYKYFHEKIEEDFEACRDSSLALIYFDVDDLKLYNQLYGNGEGDLVLKSIADIMNRAVVGFGTAFRHSGKVFAMLLPKYDVRQAYILACEIQQQVADACSGEQAKARKSITLSGGICVSPYAASTAKELSENADLAVFNAKNSGKGQINIFKTEVANPETIQTVMERALAVIERSSYNDDAYNAYSSTIFALTAAIDAKDHYTYNHSRNVAQYSIALAFAVGLNDEQIRMVYEAALLHDIGKISIPESILSKTEALTDDEYEVMKSHVNNSIEMIRHLPSMDYVIPAAISHHERWDGKGYPRGLSGEEIPISGRCLTIADSFDAMTSDRPYRSGMTADQALSLIEENAGTQFDPELAVIFVRLIRSGEVSVKATRFAFQPTLPRS